MCIRDRAQATAASYGIMSVPCVLYFKGGEKVDQDIGLNPKSVYKEKIDGLL